MGKAVLGTCDYDNCEFVGDVTQVHISMAGADWDGDLCPDHLAPLSDLLEHTAKKTRKIGGRNRVYTLEEIEQMKRGGA